MCRGAPGTCGDQGSMSEVIVNHDVPCCLKQDLLLNLKIESLGICLPPELSLRHCTQCLLIYVLGLWIQIFILRWQTCDIWKISLLSRSNCSKGDWEFLLSEEAPVFLNKGRNKEVRKGHQPMTLQVVPWGLPSSATQASAFQPFFLIFQPLLVLSKWYSERMLQ